MTLKKFINLPALLSFVASGLMAGCGPLPANKDRVPSVQLQEAAASLQGTWDTGCIFSNIHNVGYRASLIFQRDTVISFFSTFNDAKCRVPQVQEEFRGTYTLGATPNPSSGISNIDYSIKKLYISFQTQEALNFANKPKARGACDLSVFHFRKGVEQEVSSQEACLHGEWIGQVRYAVVKVNGDKLYMGRGPATGESAATRAGRIDLSKFLTRIP